MRRHFWIVLLAVYPSMAGLPAWAQQVDSVVETPPIPAPPRKPDDISPAVKDEPADSAEKAFDVNSIAKLLNKQPGAATSDAPQAAGQALVMDLTLRNPQPRGAAVRASIPETTLNEARDRFLDCWDIPVNMLPNMADYFAEVHAFLDESGNVTGRPSVPSLSGPSPNDADAFKRVAVGAVLACANKLNLPKVSYPQWSSVIFRFDLLGTRLTEPSRPFSALRKAEALNPQEMEAFRQKITALWRPPPGASSTPIIIALRLTIDGTLAARPTVLTSGEGTNYVISRVSILRAIRLAQPFDMLAPEDYSSWKELEISFNPDPNLDAYTIPPKAGDPLSTERTAVRRRILENWPTRDASGNKLDYPDISVVIALDKDGNVENTPSLSGTLPDHPLAKQALQRAIAAIYKSAPFDTLPKDKYESWKVLNMTLSVKDKAD